MCPNPYVVTCMPLAYVPGIGVTELLIVLAIVLVIFGPKRLPQLGRQLGSGMREFKESIGGRDRDGDDERVTRTQARVVDPPGPAEAPAPVAGEVRAHDQPVTGEVRAQDQPVTPRER